MSNSLVRKGLEILGYENHVKQGVLLFTLICIGYKYIFHVS